MNCAFCGPTGAPESGEDLFPLWLSRLYQRDFRFTNFRIHSETRLGRKWQGPASQRINLKVPAVCRPCNTEWMSQIENLTKPVLTPLIKQPAVARTLTNEQVTALILWMTVKAIVVDHHDVLTNNGKPFFSPQQKRRFRDDWIPPNRCTMWLARLTPVPGFGGNATADYTIWPRVKELKHLHAYALTFAALEVAIHALFIKDIARPKPWSLRIVPDNAFRIRPKAAPWSRFLVQFYPDVGLVRWAPPPQLGNNGFYALSKRLSGSTRNPYLR